MAPMLHSKLVKEMARQAIGVDDELFLDSRGLALSCGIPCYTSLLQYARIYCLLLYYATLHFAILSCARTRYIIQSYPML